MLKHVSPGDEITAEGYNSLVDAVGGPDIPTQKGFVKTSNGSIFTEWSNLDAQANMRVTDVFKCAAGPALRSTSGIGPWNNWKIPSYGTETQSTEKHLYMYLGSNNLAAYSDLNIEKNPFLNYRGIPPKFIAWSIGKYKHIVGDIDFYVNNPDSDFNEYGEYLHGDPGELGLSPYIYHGWIETPFQPTPGLKVYGAFYKLLNSSGEGEVTGTIFILTCAGDQNIDGTDTTLYPIHSFTTFIGPRGENFIVGEQVTTPVLICEMQEPQAMPGEVDGTMESSKLVQNHTGPLSYSQIEQEAQGAWSILNFVSGNENGDKFEIDSYYEMKLSHMSGRRLPPLPDFEIKTDVFGKNLLYVNNFQASGKQVVIELDSSNPVRYGLLSKDDFPQEGETALPFVNICKSKMGFYDDISPEPLQYNYEAYLVIPDKLTGVAMLEGIVIFNQILRGLFLWQPSFKVWQLSIRSGGSIGTGLMNDVLLAECRFDGTGTYTWFVPRNHIFQGSFSNLLRDISITDTQLGTEAPHNYLEYNASIEYNDILSAVDEDGNNIYEATEDYNKLSAAHPRGLQLFCFNKMNYTTPLSVGLTSAEISAEWIGNMDVVVRHRHFDPNNNKEGFKGSVIKYVPIKDLLSGEAGCMVDSEIPDVELSSVQHISSDSGDLVSLFDFGNLSSLRHASLTSMQQDESSSEGDHFLVRHVEGDESVLQYVSLSSIDVQAKTDSDIIGGRQESLSRTNIGNEEVLQAYGFNNPTTFALSAQVSATGGTATFVPVRDGLDYQISDAKVLCRTENVDGTTLRYANLKMSVVGMPNLSALNGLSVVTGIEYPMTGENQYKIVAHRKQLNIVNNVLTITNLADQTIDTVAHDTIYPNS